jgi:competence protein ComEC
MGQGTAAFLLGILAFQQMPHLPSAGWVALIPAVVLAGWRPGILRLAAWFACGFLWTLWHAQTILSTGLPAGLEGRDVVVEGVITGIPERKPGLARAELAVERLSGDGRDWPSPGRIRLSWYDRAPGLAAGERWRLVARLKRPRGFANPGGFDVEAHLFRERIRATGYVRDDPRNQRLAVDQGYRLQRARQALGSRIDAALAGGSLRGVIVALAIGDEQGISRGQWDTLRRTGTSHLVAISGLHIGLVAGLCFFLARWIWARFARGVLICPAPHIGAGAAVAGALVYSALAGFSVPTQRTLVMVGVAMGALLLKRPCSIRHAFVSALLLVLVYDPLAVMEAGFWLSFGAVAVILYGMSHRVGMKGAWWRWGRVHVLVFIGLTPLMLVLFQQNPIVSPLANFIAVPWVSLGVVPLVLVGTLLLTVVPVLGEPVLRLAEWILSGLWPMLEWFARPDTVQWTQHAPVAWTVPLAAIGAVLLLAPRGMPGRWTGAVWLAPALLIAPAPKAEGEFELTLLDVGQGLAAAVTTREHTLVFDTGARFGPDFDAGAAVLIPYLRHDGVRTVDLLILSHGDNDHIGGADSLAGAIGVGRVLSSVPEKIRQWPADRCVAGASWNWDGVSFRLLNPSPADGFSGNDASCVLLIDNGNGRALLTADIQAGAEAALVRRYADGLRAAILVAPHHGSKTSSTPAFVAAVGPRYVLFPAGYRNRWGFPHPKVVERYAATGAHLYSSAEHGAISVRVPRTGGVPSPVTYRQERARYWHES